MRWLWLFLVWLPGAALAVPPGYNAIRSTDGAVLYQNGSHFVQVIRLDQGGELRFQHGQKAGSDCFDPMNCEDLETYWGWAAGNVDAFATANAQFFNFPEDPASLTFPVKSDGEMVHCGYGVDWQTECQNQIMVEIWETRVRFSTFDHHWTTVEASSAPNVIVALREDCPKNPGASVQRTFIGSQDSNGDQKHETFFILNSQSCTQALAADILRDFGASQVAMLDGGGSTQLICQGSSLIGSSRQVPQTVLTIGSEHYRCSYGNQSNNPNWILAHPGQTLGVWVEFINEGTETWIGGNCGVGTQNCIELWACDEDGVFGESPFYPGSSWINRIRVGKANQASVPPGSVARFSFEIQIPQVGTQDLHAYFRPTHGGQRMYNWEDMNFPIHVDADAPQAPPNLAVNPTGCVPTNSFTFTWSASSDPGGSGIKGYHWKVNNGSEAFITTRTVGPIGAPNEGYNTFYVRAEDNVGNFSEYSSIQFCRTSGNNLSFDTDADGNSIPDGWVVDLHGGLYIYRDGGVDGTHFIRLTHDNPSDWDLVVRTVNGLIEPDRWYRLSFWYLTDSEGPFGWMLFDPYLNALPVLNCGVDDPLSDSQWHRFWGAPFRVTSSQLQQHSSFGFKYFAGPNGTVNIDGVVIEEVQLCQ